MAIRATDLALLLAFCCSLGRQSLPRPSDGARPRRPAAATPIRSRPTRASAATRPRPASSWISRRKVDLRAFTLADPYRVVIDLPQVTFKLPPKTGETGRGLVKAFRFGLVMQGGSRIVFDVGKPVRIDKAFVVDAAAGQPARLVLDLAAIDRESFMQTLALDKPRRAPAATRRAASARPRSKGDPRPLVVLDPGHGGIDNGTRRRERRDGEGHRAAISRCGCATSSRRSGKYRVVMTRTDDTFVPLVDRVRMARIRQAALFVSIHADALQRRARARRRARRSTRCRRPPPTPRPRALPKRRTAPTSSPASTCRMSPATSPTS